jgi:hypothetical protein
MSKNVFMKKKYFITEENVYSDFEKLYKNITNTISIFENLYQAFEKLIYRWKTYIKLLKNLYIVGKLISRSENLYHEGKYFDDNKIIYFTIIYTTSKK